MKKTIGWILLILGLIAIYGGLISKVKSDASVELIGYVFKFAMIIGGLILILSKKEDSDIKEQKDISAAKPNFNETENNIIDKYISKSITRQPIFLVSEVNGFYTLPENMIIMNKKDYHSNLLDKVTSNPYNPEFTRTIKKFIVPDNISFLKYYFNDSYFKKNCPSGLEKYVSPTLRYFADNIEFKSPIYPSWFYCLYPDVAKWYILDEGKNILKRDFMEKLAYLNEKNEYDVIKEFMETEFYDNPSGEDESLKIKPEILRELIDIYKKEKPSLMFECECE